MIRLLHRIEENIIALLLVSMAMLVVLEVVLRFGFGTGFLWSQELTLHLSAWFVLFGISYGLRVGAHIGVDAVVKLLPPTTRRIVSALAVVLSLVYCGLFLYGSWIYLAKMKKIGIELEDMPIPAWEAHSILVIGLLLFSFRLLEMLWGIYKGTSEGFRHSDEAEESMHLAEELAKEQGAQK
ncbi:MAG: TRAP transporter small permease [Gammaproteobacteria bacterium]|nr:TRAP transporter small permease [Gammaproteobacteria bacterium]